MRNWSPALLCLLALPSISPAQKYTVRELGFVEAPPAYRLVMFFNDATAIQARLDDITLAKDLRRTNIALVAIALDQRQAYPEFDRLKVPAKLTQPVYWLVAPDQRAIAIDPVVSKRELLRSPLRDQLLEDVAISLAGVVLLESTDHVANEKAKVRAENVLTQLNRVRAQLDKAPEVGLRLRVLPVNKREEERWTLWSMGEDIAPAKQPSIAVVFGSLRRAGPLLQGAAWEPELFARIAGLAQFCEAGPDRELFETAPLLFYAPPTWHDQVAASLSFRPRDSKMQAILKKPPVQRTALKLSYESLATAHATSAPASHKSDAPPLPMVSQPVAPIIGADALPYVATEPVSTAVLLMGIGGWLLLGMIVHTLEKRARA